MNTARSETDVDENAIPHPSGAIATRLPMLPTMPRPLGRVRHAPTAGRRFPPPRATHRRDDESGSSSLGVRRRLFSARWALGYAATRCSKGFAVLNSSGFRTKGSPTTAQLPFSAADEYRSGPWITYPPCCPPAHRRAHAVAQRFFGSDLAEAHRCPRLEHPPAAAEPYNGEELVFRAGQRSQPALKPGPQEAPKFFRRSPQV